MSFKRFLFIAALLCSFGVNNLRAQAQIVWPEWRLVGEKGLPGTFTAIYFFDPLHGVTAANNGATICYTARGQWIQWLQSSMPAGISLIREIRFIQGKLYAASEATDVLVSTDSGRSWNFSGLNLNNANDVYADGTGNIRILTDPMTRFARIDTMHCVATGNGSIFTSSDGGLNWISAVTGIDSMSRGAVGDPCKHVYVCPSPMDDAALRSADSGRTWQSVLTGSYPFPAIIDGANTVSYLSDLYNLYRSTDDGVTWTPIYTVDSGPLTMYVFGPMGEHVAVGWPGTFQAPSGIWMTTDGGDGNLHSGVNLTDSNGAPLLQQDTFSVPFLLTSMCNPFLIAVPFEADVSGMSEKVRVTSNNPGDFAIMGADTISMLIGRYDSLWLTYDPHHPVDTAVLTFENHWNCSDWSETRTVIITSFPKARIVPPPVLAGNCQPVTGVALLMLDSCQTLVIDSIEMPLYLSRMLRLNNPLPDTARIGVNDSLFFTFDPADTVATISDSVQIFAHYLGRDLDPNLNYFNFNAYLGDSDFAFFQQFVPANLQALPILPWGLYPSPPDSAVPGADVTFKIIQSGTLPSDVTTLNFTLTYNDDLLSFVRAEEPASSTMRVDTIGYTRTPDGLAHVTFHVSPVGRDSVVATLHFYPYVARATQTAIVLSTPSLLTKLGIKEECIDSITTGETMFTLLPVCGSGELSNFLQNGTVLIDNIAPNPATGSIVVGVSSAGSSAIPAELSIVDALGRTVCRQDVVLAGGEGNYIPLNLENLPSGIYAVRLRAGGLASTQEFVKE